MYTESFAGDIDEILKRESLKFVHVFTLPEAYGRMDAYGFARNQRQALATGLLRIGRNMMSDYRPAVIHIDAQRKITLTTWWQAANLYQTLTRNDWYAGLDGKKAKPQIKRYTH